MLEKMVALRRHDEEPLDRFMERFHRKIKHLKTLHGFIDWDRRYHMAVFTWAGHVAHMKAYDGGRITVKVLEYRCCLKRSLTVSLTEGLSATSLRFGRSYTNGIQKRWTPLGFQR